MTICLPHFLWLAATAIAFSSITTPAFAAEFNVLSVGDGDTIRVSTPSGTNKTTVRLACIDAPETSQVLGIDARQALQAELPIGTDWVFRIMAWPVVKLSMLASGKTETKEDLT